MGSALIAGALWLVVLYNLSVDLEYKLKEAKAEFQKIEAQNAEFQDKIFAVFKSENLENFAKDKGLIKDQEPEYFRLTQQWAQDSQ